MSATKSDLRRAILRTAAQAHWRHDHTRRGLPCAVNDCPSLRDRNGQEAAVSPIPSAVASDDLHVSHAAAMQQPGA